MTALKSIFDRYNLDGVYLSSRENILWATGLRCGYGFLIILRDGTYFCTDDQMILKHGPGISGVTCIDLNTAVLSSFLEEHAVKRLGYEDDNLSCRRYEHEKQEFFLHVQLYPVSGAIEGLRQIKEPKEIVSLVYAQKKNHLAYSYILKNVREGMTESELALMIHTFFWNQGIFEQSFEPIVLFGERTILGHEKPGMRQLEINEPVLVDFGCKHNGYCSDFARTFFFGTEDSEFTNVSCAVQQAYRTAISHMKPGIQGKEIDRHTRLALSGYENIYSDSLAHGVGVAVHEKPFVNKMCTSQLEQDMVLSLEPSAIYKDCFCVRFEDLVRVTNEGAVNLVEFEQPLGV